MKNKRVLIPLPSYGFDPSEAAVPWKVLTANRTEIVFATPDGRAAAADIRMLKGRDLGIWKPLLQARQDAVQAYADMEKAAAFMHPVAYADIRPGDYDALLLPGGHDKGVREYLESAELQKTVVSFFREEKPVAAICHGVVLAARSTDPQTSRSVLYGYRTTALLGSQETAAYRLTRLWLGDYYLTYPGLTVEAEVKSVLKDVSQFSEGPAPLRRDSLSHPERGFTVRDRNYLSARWPGDAYRFSRELLLMLEWK